jgi:hypothetical protein
MALSAKDRHFILINTVIEHERMFTVLGHLCSNDPDKTMFLAEIEASIKGHIKALVEMEPCSETQTDRELSDATSPR